MSENETHADSEPCECIEQMFRRVMTEYNTEWAKLPHHPAELSRLHSKLGQALSDFIDTYSYTQKKVVELNNVVTDKDARLEYAAVSAERNRHRLLELEDEAITLLLKLGRAAERGSSQQTELFRVREALKDNDDRHRCMSDQLQRMLDTKNLELKVLSETLHNLRELGLQPIPGEIAAELQPRRDVDIPSGVRERFEEAIQKRVAGEAGDLAKRDHDHAQKIREHDHAKRYVQKVAEEAAQKVADKAAELPSDADIPSGVRERFEEAIQKRVAGEAQAARNALLDEAERYATDQGPNYHPLQTELPK